MVKKKLKEYSLGYLTTIKEKHSTMDQLVYPKLKIQNYLKYLCKQLKPFLDGEPGHPCSRQILGTATSTLPALTATQNLPCSTL